MTFTRQYTIWCDDGRYCTGEHLQLDVDTKEQARKAARAQGWRTSPDQCPQCQHRRRASGKGCCE